MPEDIFSSDAEQPASSTARTGPNLYGVSPRSGAPAVEATDPALAPVAGSAAHGGDLLRNLLTPFEVALRWTLGILIILLTQVSFFGSLVLFVYVFGITDGIARGLLWLAADVAVVVFFVLVLEHRNWLSRLFGFPPLPGNRRSGGRLCFP